VPAVAARVFSASIGELRRISSWWREWALSAGISDDATDAGELCLNEAAANIVLHGCADGTPHEVAITLDLFEGRARITVSDDGRAFNPLDHPLPASPTTLEDATIGGRGIGLIRSYAPDVRYRYENGRNVLVLRLAR
jgi:anti-sigma regulatory factor (Ser/Thr protein kinase)